jgi:hypothetical protein
MEVAAEFNLALRFVPRVVTAVTMTTAINDTRRPYSTALAPDSSLKKFLIRSMVFSPYGLMMVGSCLWFWVVPV